jgi:hypothetical protein
MYSRESMLQGIDLDFFSEPFLLNSFLSLSKSYTDNPFLHRGHILLYLSQSLMHLLWKK